MKEKIVFTGGHHNSALVVAKDLKKEGYQIYWIGHKFNFGGDKSISAEYQEVVADKIPFFVLTTGRFYRQLNHFEQAKNILRFFQALI